MTQSSLRNPRAIGLLVLFVAVVVGVGSTIGIFTSPGQWYDGLNKPFFNPPNWIFGPVWSTLYVLIAVAGWRTFMREPNGLGMKLWYGQMVFNWLWSPVWFGLQLIWPAFFVILVIDALVLAFIVNRWSRDRASALMFIPYLAWVLFASMLNLAIGILN